MADDFQWWSALDTAAAVRSRAISASEVVEAAILRIERLDPQLGAVVIPLFERAREVGADRPGALFRGVPMLLKDAGEELAGTSHWVGTLGLAREGYRSVATTEVAQELERLGFVFVGKSACPELSAGSTTEPAGFAPTRNPWSLDRTVGGSSGGSAAAVAAGMVPIAHGTDGTGSLRFPAAHCGVVTLKPTRGRIPQTPPTGQVDPLRGWTQFALARDVNDLRELFPLLAGGQAARNADGLQLQRQLRVGLLDHDPIIGLQVAEECAYAVHVLGDAMNLLGHHVEIAHPPALETLSRPFWTAMTIIGPVLRREQVEWMSQRLGRACRLGDVTEEVFDLAERGRTINVMDVAAAWENVRVAMAGVPDWWDSGFDILATPVTLQPAWKLGEDGPSKTGMFCAPFSFTGQPALVVPVTMTDASLPVGVQLVGRLGDDELLLELGSQLQTVIGWLDRRPPTS